MSDFACGCAVDGPRRCADHRDSECHGGGTPGGECPRCRRERWLSIGNGYRPTRTFRPSNETLGLEGVRRG